jgi:1-phosphofructokinase
MIATVTLNPSLDYIVKVNNFEVGGLNRTDSEIILPGGKGINVSIVLNNLAIDTKSFGFCAGFTGREFEKLLSDMNVASSFINVNNGITRINVKIQGKNETEVNGLGPLISDEETEKLFTQLDNLKSSDILVLAGSIPSTLSKNIYSTIMKRLSNKGIKIVVDTTNELLLNCLEYKPFLIKPNKVELGELFDVKIQNGEDSIKYAKELRKMGAQNVLVSLGKDGAILVDNNDKIHSSIAIGGKVVNSVGAGDSMVAGFLAGYIDNKDYERAFRLGLCAGGASATSRYLATKTEVEKLMNEFEDAPKSL